MLERPLAVSFQRLTVALRAMKAVIQRCHRAQVEVGGEVVGSIGRGLAIFVGIETNDNEERAARLAQKIAALRIFNNAEGKFDLSVQDIGGAALVIPNFTLCGEARKGARPNFGGAAPPALAEPLCERFVTLLRHHNIPVETGVFGAMMNVQVENDGPVTMILEF